MTFHLAYAVDLWMRHDRRRRECGLDILHRFDFSSFSLPEICAMSALGSVRGCRPLFAKIVSSVAKVVEQTKECIPVTLRVWSQGQAGNWTAQSSGWYFLLARGQRGSSWLSIRGGRGAMVGGAYFMQEGDKLLVSAGGTSHTGIPMVDSAARTGSRHHAHGKQHVYGGDASYIVSMPAAAKAKSPKVLLVAGGGGCASAHREGGQAVLEEPVDTSGRTEGGAALEGTMAGIRDNATGMSYRDVAELGQPMQGGTGTQPSWCDSRKLPSGAGYVGGQASLQSIFAPSTGGSCFIDSGFRQVLKTHSFASGCEIQISSCCLRMPTFDAPASSCKGRVRTVL
eukprot:evm.model.scf_641.5 EVM.evm.TU.scf_641.5   scf_641:71181-72200(+)